ncbi:sulfite exporter TauE/SafE family protein [Frigoriflavimonas asaccharolytica]|uniref:Probable membrane transporter protein n=1 Tax=Frigoriflavimonas asaccharolytica TaxID=2735899 RepID=A0A8J8G896_9FLAO|nr:sulfite exporter TauE/SafE family protein [Frigoriflavimonas asaccharolytica]NRS91334.1 hypothetical protein [Frigoriflavimonas asaccharolytica]
MDLILILGYLGALIIGVILGLIGGGGSILTVPIFVYLLEIEPVTATAYSLFVVGGVALVGSGKNVQKGLIDFKTALTFAIPAVISVFSVRKFLVPAIPETLFSIGDFTLTKDIAIMVFFAILMLTASIAMIKNTSGSLKSENDEQPSNKFILAMLGLLTGLITGIVGAGGGFIIIPILVLLADLPIKKAVATSLFIIAISSLIGFLGDVNEIQIDWKFLLPFTGVAIAGIFLGIYLNKFIDGKKLKTSFGWFVLIMGIYILSKEIFF